MKKYKKRVTDVEALQWTGDNIGEMAAFLGLTVIDNTIHFDGTPSLIGQFEVTNGAVSFQLRSPSGYLQVRPTDYVLKQDDNYTVTSTIDFATNYEEIP